MHKRISQKNMLFGVQKHHRNEDHTERQELQETHTDKSVAT